MEGFVAGLHRSPFHGFSIEFAEHREYSPGDDLRYVDWKVYSRTDKIYVKQYEDETNLVCYLIVDSSESMTYKSDEATLSKLEYAQCLAIALSWLVLHQQDAVGMATFDQQLRNVVRPSSQANQLNQLVQVLELAPHDKKTQAGLIFHELAQRLPRRGVVVILSDLLDNVDSMLSGLKHLRHARHDVILWHILDRAELDFPFSQQTLFQGLEEWPEVMVDAAGLRHAYQEEFQGFLERVRGGCRGQQIDYQMLVTDQPFDTSLSAYLAQRAARVK